MRLPYEQHEQTKTPAFSYGRVIIGLGIDTYGESMNSVGW